MIINYDNKTIEAAIIEFNKLSIVEQAKETNEILEDYLKKSREDILTKRKETNKTIRMSKIYMEISQQHRKNLKKHMNEN